MFLVNEKLNIISCWFPDEPVFKSKIRPFIYRDIMDCDYEKFEPLKLLNEKKLTLITDLSDDMLSIFNSFKKNIRYEIKKATDLDIRIDIKNDLSNEEFFLINSLYNSLSLPLLTEHRLGKYPKDNFIVFSAYHKNYLVCVHVYLMSSKRSRLLYSASRKDKISDINIDSSFINRYLHYKDIEWFKKKGCSLYDWGGISSLDKPNGVDRFKLGFSGKPVHIYTIYSPLLSLAKKVGLF